MPQIIIKTEISVQIDICFDLARDIGFYYNSLKKITEIPVSGKITGLIEAGEYVTWETNHLNLMQHLTLRVTEFNKPYLFVDEMVKDKFKSYRHDHIFEYLNGKTIMTDKFYFESSYGILGKIIDKLFLKTYFEKQIKTRNEILRQKAEELSCVV
ncbi:SRPBCC family protein [Winogradskyella sp.]|uniref:SRPBCC family protein n=1 Tax=Winogradskyella sp. TaxID=1883156 RepID=UPI003F6C05E4